MKKLLGLLLVLSLMVTSDCSNLYIVNAATDTEDHGFTIDEKMFDVNWNETGKIRVYQTARSWDSDFDKGVYLGYAEVYAGFATAKYKVDKKYYQRVMVHADMVPCTVEGTKAGMSQYLTVKLANSDYMKVKTIEPGSTSGRTSYSTTGSVGSTGSTGVSADSTGKLTLNGGRTYSLGASSTTSWDQGSLIVITNKDDNGWGVWEYDYVSSKNKEQNAYLFGSSEQRGLYCWNIKKNENYVMASLSFKVTATFGGGDKATNERAKEMISGAYNLGSASKSVTINHQ